MEAGVSQAPTDRVTLAKKHVEGELGAHFGKSVFLRIVKEDWLLELWVKEGEYWRILKTYEIAAMSGGPGPKEAEKDSPHCPFWQYLQPGWQHTCDHKEPYQETCDSPASI